MTTLSQTSAAATASSPVLPVAREWKREEPRDEGERMALEGALESYLGRYDDLVSSKAWIAAIRLSSDYLHRYDKLLSQRDKGVIHARRGFALVEKNKHKQAIKDYTKALDLIPKSGNEDILRNVLFNKPWQRK